MGCGGLGLGGRAGGGGGGIESSGFTTSPAAGIDLT